MISNNNPITATTVREPPLHEDVAVCAGCGGRAFKISRNMNEKCAFCGSFKAKRNPVRPKVCKTCVRKHCPYIPGGQVTCKHKITPPKPVSKTRCATAGNGLEQSPDYRNSVKESISAVEAMCQILTGDPKATLGQAIKKLEECGVSLHPALRDALSKLYGYTNDGDGIRYALLDESNLSVDDAKFMLVTCSAFANYLATKSALRH